MKESARIKKLWSVLETVDFKTKASVQSCSDNKLSFVLFGQYAVCIYSSKNKRNNNRSREEAASVLVVRQKGRGARRDARS